MIVILAIGVFLWFDDFSYIYPYREKILDWRYDSKICHVKVESDNVSLEHVGKLNLHEHHCTFSYTVHGSRFSDKTNDYIAHVCDSGYVKYYIGDSHIPMFTLDTDKSAQAHEVIGKIGFYSDGRFYDEHEYSLKNPQYMLNHFGVTIAYRDCDSIIFQEISPVYTCLRDSAVNSQKLIGIDIILNKTGYCYVYDGKFYPSDEMESQCPEFKAFMEDYLKSNTPSWYTEFLESGRTEE